ncbi:thioredoxin family protein [Anaerofustis stercorihominis]|uniref:Thioredoxin n=3 Tax=Anaerofustis stercorihominis TaxID=214853 RepID=B1C7F2_9FIRM|nr:thioredoxin family protein [Anaerofustis stercorihominis]EDS72939.1 thioredoxin [Anaerofustis stercorihominis DSM 17244]RGD74524.1 thioredoxin [Anaerofustis stercorihominis]
MNKKILRIVIPVLIVISVIGIYIVKNNNDNALGNSGSDTSSATFDLNELKKEKLPIVLDFSSATCPPCREMEPTLHKLKEEYKGKVIIKSISVDADVKGIEDFPVKVTPTLFFFDEKGNPYKPSKDIDIQMIEYSSKADNKHIYTAREGLLTEDEFLKIFKDMGIK